MAHPQHSFVFTANTLALVLSIGLVACGSEKTEPSNSGTGGSANGGSTASAGGNDGNGGSTASGGTSSDGGSSASQGGSVNSGGSVGVAGTSAAAGATNVVSVADCKVWVAADGDDTSPGSETQPVLTLAKAYDLICPAPPTGTANGAECLLPAPRMICIKPGTHAMSLRFELKKTRMGTEASPITIQGDPRSAAKPVLDFTTQARVASCGAATDSSGGELTGITMNADYTVLRHVEIKNANDNCVKVQGAHNLVEDVVVHGCADVGIQVSSGSGYTGSGSYNTILNCDSYQNNDVQCNGNTADGFAVKVGTALGIEFRGCRAWDNADDGWDLTSWTSPILLDNCWAMNQATTTLGTNSDGDGMKLGGNGQTGTNGLATAHVLSNLIAVGNTNGSGAHGIGEGTNTAPLTCTGTCAAWGNGNDTTAVTGVSTTPIANVTAASLISAARNSDGSLPKLW
jgi:hypothetical protein